MPEKIYGVLIREIYPNDGELRELWVSPEILDKTNSLDNPIIFVVTQNQVTEFGRWFVAASLYGFCSFLYVHSKLLPKDQDTGLGGWLLIIGGTTALCYIHWFAKAIYSAIKTRRIREEG